MGVSEENTRLNLLKFSWKSRKKTRSPHTPCEKKSVERPTTIKFYDAIKFVAVALVCVRVLARERTRHDENHRNHVRAASARRRPRVRRVAQFARRLCAAQTVYVSCWHQRRIASLRCCGSQQNAILAVCVCNFLRLSCGVDFSVAVFLSSSLFYATAKKNKKNRRLLLNVTRHFLSFCW